MTPDDKRHGTVTGYRVHHRTKTPYCDPCRNAWRLNKAASKPVAKKATVVPIARKRERSSFVDSGYSPDDGLGPGQWVPRPGSAGVLDWRPARGGAA